MKEAKRRTEIMIETHSLTIIRMRGGITDSAFCKNCQQETRFFTFEQAALIFRISGEFLEALMRSNQVHTVSENTVCANSLAEYFKHEIRFVED